MKKNSSILPFTLLILIATSGFAAAQSATPVTINFDDLARGTRVTSVYMPRVYFSNTHFFGGAGAEAVDPVAVAYPPPFGVNNALLGLWRNCNCFLGNQDVYVDFRLPVNNLRFNMLNYYSGRGYPAAYIDVYSNYFYYGTTSVYPNFNQGTVPIVSLSTIPNITGIKIWYISNYDPYGNQIPLYFDDFTFAPDLNISITNPRVSGPLNDTTQNALVGGSIALNTNITPPGRTGGGYSWTITGPYQLVSGSTNVSTLNIRATDAGTLTAEVTYTLNGYPAKGKVTINAIVPTLSNFSASVDSNVLDRAGGCSNLFYGGTTYTLGCYLNAAEKGIVWSATAVIPNLTYLTEPADSGIKFKNAVNIFRKRLNNGRIECKTLRSSPSNLASGWGLDTADPYNHLQHPPRFFNQGNSLTMGDFDAPGETLDGTINNVSFFYDAKYADDYFETYVFYFIGDPASPTFEYPKPLHLTNSQFLTDRIEWNWGGTVYFDSINNPVRYREQSATTRTGLNLASGTNSPVSLQTLVTGAQPPFSLCTGSVNTQNAIDGTRFFVRQLYADLLMRNQPDAGGWNFWTTQMTTCVFDTNCIYGSRNQGAYHGKRTDVAKAFFDAAPFNQTDPDLANPPGSPGYNQLTYNTAFVKQCYFNFFQRLPDQGGSNFWVNTLNSTGDYLGVIDAFVNGSEYRQRFGAADPRY